jgi:hypothetical protein
MPSSTATAVADALQRAQQAVDGLGDDDASFWQKMHGWLRAARQQLQRSDHGKTPALPDRYDNLNKLKSGNPRRPVRAAVYDAMDALIAAAWPPTPPMSNTERSQKKRQHDSAAAAEAEQRVRQRIAQRREPEPLERDVQHAKAYIGRRVNIPWTSWKGYETSRARAVGTIAKVDGRDGCRFHVAFPPELGTDNITLRWNHLIL